MLWTAEQFLRNLWLHPTTDLVVLRFNTKNDTLGLTMQLISLYLVIYLV